MFKYKAGFIGAGNMGGALAQAVCKTAQPENVIVSCKTEEEAKNVSERLSCVCGSVDDVVKYSEFVFLGFKPQNLEEILVDLSEKINKKSIVVSMLAGVTIDTLESILGKERKIIRIMPNTPCTVGKGMMLMCENEAVYDAEIEDFKDMMTCSGEIDEIPEKLIDAASAVCLLKRWQTAVLSVVFRGIRRLSTPHRLCLEAGQWSLKQADTLKSLRMLCVVPEEVR